MSMSLSSRRFTSVPAPVFFDDSKSETTLTTAMNVLAMFFGAILLYMSALTETRVLAAIGMVGFTVPFMYLNCMFWSRVYKDQKAPKYSHYTV